MAALARVFSKRETGFTSVVLAAALVATSGCGPAHAVKSEAIPIGRLAEIDRIPPEWRYTWIMLRCGGGTTYHELHPVSRRILWGFVQGVVSVDQFKRSFALPNSDYLKMIPCIVSTLTDEV